MREIFSPLDTGVYHTGPFVQKGKMIRFRNFCKYFEPHLNLEQAVRVG